MATGLNLTRVVVFELVGEVLVLMDPLAVAFEEDLQRRRRPTPQLDGVALDNVGVRRLLQEVRQRPRSRGRRVQLSAPCGACREQHINNTLTSFCCSVKPSGVFFIQKGGDLGTSKLPLNRKKNHLLPGEPGAGGVGSHWKRV